MGGQHILFVETSGDTLKGLMRNLSSEHSDWEIVLMADADAALEMLQQRRFSIVITSFGDRNTACEEFLHGVQQRLPDGIRFALLPRPDTQDSGASLEHAYQCFSDQCPADEIAAAIQRGIKVWERSSSNPALTQLLSQINDIPTPPLLYFEIREEVNSPNSDAHSISDILSRDPAVCTRLLRVANSGFYALPRTISNVYEAVTILGTDTVVSLVLAIHVFRRLPIPGINLDALWKHSLTASILCQEIARKKGGNRLAVNTAGVAGLLHDIGQLIFLSNMPERFHPLLRSSGGIEDRLLQLEQESFGLGHPELGAHLLALWSLPDVVVEAVARHHEQTWDNDVSPDIVTCSVITAEWVMQQFSDHGDSVTQWQKDHSIIKHTSEELETWRLLCVDLLAKTI